MKVGLWDMDGNNNFPNLALMKISTYHKNCNDKVEKFMPLETYDIVYISKVFSEEYSAEDISCIQADKVVYGGTGFAITVENGKEVYHKEKDTFLPEEIEHCYPDYSLYSEITKDTAYGFLTRGCPNNCPFCIVSSKEGRCSKKVADLSEFYINQKTIKLLDPNILACKEHIELLKQLAESQANVDFTQGLDARLINDENISLFKKIKVSGLHFAFDLMKNEKDIIKGLKLYADNVGLKSRDADKTVYILTNYNTTLEEDLYRIYKVKELGYSPYVMIYRKPSAPKITKHLQRWCNNRIIFNTVEKFDDYTIGNKKIKDLFKL